MTISTDADKSTSLIFLLLAQGFFVFLKKESSTRPQFPSLGLIMPDLLRTSGVGAAQAAQGGGEEATATSSYMTSEPT